MGDRSSKLSTDYSSTMSVFLPPAHFRLASKAALKTGEITITNHIKIDQNEAGLDSIKILDEKDEFSLLC